jgi:hypothetical protein
MTEDQIRTAVQSAITAVRGEVRPLLFRRVHERSIAYRLALHMERHFRPHDWDIDCEYDLDGQMKKTLEGIAECDGRKTDLILPDIIVHHREHEGRTHNLLAVELKKNADEDACDRRKLELLTNPDGHYQYQLGLYVNVDGGNFTCTWYREGQSVQELE